MQYDTGHPAYPILQRIGREITEKVKPKAVVVFSGHWEAERDRIEVNSAEHTDLIYECVAIIKFFFVFFFCFETDVVGQLLWVSARVL